MANFGKVDLGIVHVVPPGKVTFSAETYLGNWYEETVRNTVSTDSHFRNEFDVKYLFIFFKLAREEFVKKRECEELSIQKSQTMVDFLLKPVSD